MKLEGKEIELDSEGYLVEPSDWDKAVAIELANSEGLTIGDDSWKVLESMRKYYAEYRVIPDVRHTTKQMVEIFSITKKEAKAKLFTMFPYGYVKQACKLAGMRRPRAWSTG